MKTKTITLTLNVPNNIKYLAVQPWGEIMLFPKKPRIVLDRPLTEPDNTVDSSEYWDVQVGELTLSSEDNKGVIEDCNRPKNWKETVQKLGA